MSIFDKFADRFAAKAAVAGLDRMDLSIQDYAIAKDGSARILVGYDKKLKHPTPSALASYISMKFHGKLEPQLATAQWHPDSPTPAVSVIVTASKLTRPFEDRKALTPVIANTLYLDQTIDANWEVKVNPQSGKKYLACVRAEDVGGMLQSAKARVTTASFLGSSTAVGFILPEKGDYVEFFAEDGLRQGEVTKVKDQEATIIEEGGTTYLVEIQSVTKMLKKNQKALTQQEEQLIQALIPAMVTREMAEQVVRGRR